MNFPPSPFWHILTILTSFFRKLVKMTEVHEIEEEHYYIKPDNCVEYEEDAENVEQVEEEEKIILIVPTGKINF